MKAAELWTLIYALNSLWQAPLIFVAAWLAARLAQRSGSQMEYRIWTGALLLSALLPACNFAPGRTGELLWSFLLPHRVAPGGGVRITEGPGVVGGGGLLHLSETVTVMLLCAWAASVLYFAGRLVWGLLKTNFIVRCAQPLVLKGEAAESWVRLRQMFGAEGRGRARAAELGVSAMISGPVTVGIRRRLLLIPPGLLEGVGAGDLEALLAHELAHMQRRDFAWNLAFGVLSLPVAWHPLIWAMRVRIAESRELICDAMAAEAADGREHYARSLLRLAALLADPAPILHAIGIFDANNFERRIMSLTGKRVEMQGLRRLGVAAACAVMAIAVCGSALALRVEVGTSSQKESAPKQIHVRAESLKLIHKVTPEYPAEAKASGHSINGAVLLDVVVGKDGEPEHIEVSKSLREDYDSSAIDAVRQWKWEPFLLNGQPIEVKTTISVVFSQSR